MWSDGNFACWVIFHAFVVFFLKILSGTLSEGQFGFRSLIWVQTVCKGYQQTTKVATNCLISNVNVIIYIVKNSVDPDQLFRHVLIRLNKIENSVDLDHLASDESSWFGSTVFPKKEKFWFSRTSLSLVLLNPDLSCLENTVDPDQMASDEAILSGSTLFSTKLVK